MKKLFYAIILTVVITTSAAAQKITEANVPPEVMKTFNTSFSSAEATQWEVDYDNYIAKLKNNKVAIEVTFTKDGKWLTTETPVTHSALPASVKACLTKQFDIYKENDIEKVDSPQGTNYSIDLECNQLNYEVVISDKGDLVSRDEVKEYKKEE